MIEEMFRVVVFRRRLTYIISLAVPLILSKFEEYHSTFKVQKGSKPEL